MKQPCHARNQQHVPLSQTRQKLVADPEEGPGGGGPPSFLDELAVKPKWNCHVKNIGRLSNNDGESNKNVPSYQNECVFLFCFVLFFYFFAFISTLLK